jgi:hypothetical protein
MTKIKEDRLIVSWLPHEIAAAEAQYIIENWEENSEDNTPCPPEDKVLEDIFNDSCFFQNQWDDLYETLTESLKEMNPKGSWFVIVKNFGWQKLDGQKSIQIETGREFLQKVLPDCECMFSIYSDGKRLRITNSHHDSPYGNEAYYACKNHPTAKKAMRKKFEI